MRMEYVMKINKTILRTYLQAEAEEIAAMTQAVAIGTEARKLWHVDRGPDVKVLAVAHLDYVHAAQHAPQTLTIHPRGGEPREYMFHPAHDDRLGAYIIGSLLPLLGVQTDILWTFDEEIGQTTAALYTAPKKEYNWIFSFDRRGDDVVGYSYESDPRWSRYVQEVGFKKGYGSFSCIQALRHLGVLGFNFGTGYHNEHQVMCFADLAETAAQVLRFVAFWKLRKDERMEYKPANNFLSGGYQGESAWRNTSNYGNTPYTSYGGLEGGVQKGETQQQLFRGMEQQASAPKSSTPLPAPSAPSASAAKIITLEARAKEEDAALRETAERMLLDRDLPDNAGTSPFDPEPCVMCQNKMRRMYYSPESEIWLCGSCAVNFLDSRDYVYGSCEDCGLVTLVSMATVRYGYPLCDECRDAYSHGRSRGRGRSARNERSYNNYGRV